MSDRAADPDPQSEIDQSALLAEYAAEIPAIIWSIGTLVVFFPVGLWLYNRRTTQ